MDDVAVWHQHLIDHGAADDDGVTVSGDCFQEFPEFVFVMGNLIDVFVDSVVFVREHNAVPVCKTFVGVRKAHHGVSAHDDCSVMCHFTEMLHIPFDVEEQLVVSTNAPVLIDADNGFEFFVHAYAPFTCRRRRMPDYRTGLSDSCSEP